MKSILVVVAAATLLMAGCSSAKSVIRTGSPALSISVYSDAEYTALKPKLKNIDDVFSMPKTAISVADGTTVDVTQTEMLSIHSDVAPPVEWPFERVRVLSGPSAGSEGWISGYGFALSGPGAGSLGLQPILQDAKS